MRLADSFTELFGVLKHLPATFGTNHYLRMELLTPLGLLPAGSLK